MAKGTKKKSKNLKIKKSKEKPRKVAPEIPPGLISVAMSREDLSAFANLMSICAKTFEGLAAHAAQQHDEANYSILLARYRLSTLFAERLLDACRMPEPISRDFH